MKFDLNEIVEEINSSTIWDKDLLAEFCSIAGIEEEWENADGENFEKVVYKAAEILGVEIF